MKDKEFEDLEETYEQTFILAMLSVVVTLILAFTYYMKYGW